ncbi:SDR family NAD(P)-dependent oxidoreductase [Neisseria sp. Ec49-e6-T10]|uniref:SDR family NAD(P)-dependent oxidoreductase n=1 Tax=Neisseria sp. Ec49-e6-T10 TaxID=3140744 RepID=UPI003EB84280
MHHTGVMITGVSSGLGKELAKQCLMAGAQVFGVSRTCPDDIVFKHEKFVHKAVDLSASFNANGLIQEALAVFAQDEHISQLLLINNAGTVEPIALSGHYPNGAVEKSFFLNSVAPILLVNAFVSALGSDTPAKIVNISSGAATTAYSGWGVYCATKAALNQFSEVVALEHQHIKIVSLAPGVVDTGMQQKIRYQSEQDFPNVERFITLHEEGQLSRSDVAAQKILNFIHSKAFGQKVNVDIRKL